MVDEHRDVFNAGPECRTMGATRDKREEDPSVVPTESSGLADDGLLAERQETLSPHPLTLRRSSADRPAAWASSVRVACHLVVWAVVLTPTLIEMVVGWRPLGDDADISLRSQQVFSLHPPLLGQLSTVSHGAGGIIYDLGPSLYWLLAVPVKLDPSTGALWGAAVLCGLVLSLAIEALWSCGLKIGCAIVPLMTADLVIIFPGSFSHLTLNPYFGLVWLVATVGIGWAVARGAVAWWPILVVVASVTVQSDLIFAVVGAGLVLVCPLVALARPHPPEGKRWVVVGLALGALCWVAPAIQQLTGHPGNVTLLWQSRGREPALGIRYSIRSLTAIGSPDPMWFHSIPKSLLTASGGSPSLWGTTLLIVFALLIMAKLRTGSSTFSSLVVVTTVLLVSAVGTFAIVPKQHSSQLFYLLPWLWIVSLLVWIIGLWALCAFVVGWAADTSAMDPGTRLSRSIIRLRAGLAVMVTVGVVAVGLAAAAKTVAPARKEIPPVLISNVERISTSIERSVPKGPVELDFQPRLGLDAVYEVLDGPAVMWQLAVDGWHPELTPDFTSITGLDYPAGPGWPRVQLTPTAGGGFVVVRVR
jgi:hypothetical protein